MEVVDRILDVGRRNGVNAVLCAGDLFDDPTPVEDFWEGLARRLRDHPGPHVPVFLVPGNHDPLTTESVWAPTHPFRSRLPNWVHVVDRDDFSFELTPDAIQEAAALPKGIKRRLRNILARFNPSAKSRVLYVTHWDTRPTADDDPNFGNKARPILGANDGGSGVGLFIALIGGLLAKRESSRAGSSAKRPVTRAPRLLKPSLLRPKVNRRGVQAWLRLCAGNRL